MSTTTFFGNIPNLQIEHGPDSSMSGSHRFGSASCYQSSILKPQIPPKPSHLHSSVSSRSLALNRSIGSVNIQHAPLKDVLPPNQLTSPPPMQDVRAVPRASNFPLGLQDINREPINVWAHKNALACHTTGANLMSKLGIGQSLKENLSPAIRHENVLEHGDQSTIKAVKRQTWDSAHAMQKLMRQGESGVVGGAPRARDVEEGVVRGPRIYSPDRRLAAFQSAVTKNDGYQQIPAPHSSIKTRDDHLQLLERLSPTRKLKGKKSTHHLSNPNRPFPQKALALYSFVPEPVHRELQTETLLEKNPPMTGFSVGDTLEIWLPDIGGGWSLGKNLANTEYEKGRVEDESESLGLIPIGWYRIVEPNEHREKKLPSDIASEHGRFHEKPNGPEGNRLWSDNAHESAPDSTLIKPPPTGWAESPLSEAPANSPRSNSRTAKFKLDRSKIVTKAIDKVPRGALSPPSVGPSVSLSKEFDPSGIYLERPSRGTACSVTASDAIYAARQRSSKGSFHELARARNSIQNERKFIWNPFLHRGASGRRSTAQSYIVNGGSLSKDPDYHDTCTEKYEIGVGPSWKNPGPLYPVQVHSPELRVHRSTFKAHTSFAITSTFFHDETSAQSGTVKLQITVDRRYSHFERMSLGLSLIYGDVVDLPPLPEKRYQGRFNKQFIESRRRGLERYLARLTRNPVLRYCPIVTTFLGCEDEDDFDQQAKQWGSNNPQSPQREVGPDVRSPASLSFFSKVFHPDYNADEADAERSVEAFNRYTKSLESGRGVIELEASLANVRTGIQELGIRFQSMSNSISNLYGGLSLPAVPTHELGNWSDEQGLPSLAHESVGLDRAGLSADGMLDIRKEDILQARRSSSCCAGLQNSDGALCWKEECRECLATTKALQMLGKSLTSVAVIYSKCAEEALAPVQDLLKELSYPRKARQVCIFRIKISSQLVFKNSATLIISTPQVLSNLHESTKIYALAGKSFESEDQFESRKETVLNVVMSEVERHHQERNEDFRELAQKLIESQIKLHEMACEQLKQAKHNFEEPQYSSLALPGPKAPSCGETQLCHTLADHCHHSLSLPHSRSYENSKQISTANPLGPSSVLEWISGSAINQARHDICPREPRQRGNSVESSASTVASSAFSAVFVKPLSAAVASVIDFKQFLYKP